jgi:hypothetical protein
MNALGTDVLALACILGGAAVSGGATLAALDRSGSAECRLVEASGPRMIVRVGADDREVVVVPRVHVRGAEGCAPVVVEGSMRVDVDVDAIRTRVEEARARAEIARERALLARERAEQARVRAGSIRDERIEERIREEMTRLERELERLRVEGIVR